VPGDAPLFTFTPEPPTIALKASELPPIPTEEPAPSAIPPAPPAEPAHPPELKLTPPEPMRAVKPVADLATEPPAPRPQPAPAKPAVRVDEPTIQISADLLDEMETAVAQEATRIGRNPLQEEKTDPHIRMP
jgi:hypothetical protein